MAGIVRKAYRRLAQGLPGDPPARKDIDLPSEGRRDPRLPAKPSVGGAFRKAGEGFKFLRSRGMAGKR